MTRRSIRSGLTAVAFLAITVSNIGGCAPILDLADLVSQFADQGTTGGAQNGGNEVELPKPNIPPTASAGDDVTAAAGETVFLDGSKSGDTDGDNLRIIWTQIEGDPVVELSSPFASVASFDAPADVKTTTTLKFRITVIDGHVATSDDVSVIITP